MCRNFHHRKASTSIQLSTRHFPETPVYTLDCEEPVIPRERYLELVDNDDQSGNLMAHTAVGFVVFSSGVLEESFSLLDPLLDVTQRYKSILLTRVETQERGMG